MADSRLTYKQLLTKVKSNLAPSLAEDWPELAAVRSEGVYLYTEDGRQIWILPPGLASPTWGITIPKCSRAAIEQMKKFSHSAVGITLHEPLLRLTEVLPDSHAGRHEDVFLWQQRFRSCGRRHQIGALCQPASGHHRLSRVVFTGAPMGQFPSLR